ncbi:MAG: cupin domain-containing protein [Tateyamaria sp.]
MTRLLTVLAACLMAGTAWAADVTREEIRRTAVPGSETMIVVVSKLTVPPGATIDLHTHAGDEHAVVITPTKAQAPNGNVLEFPVGATLYFPEGQVHGGLTNIGEADMVAITTQIVRGDAPLSTPVN